MKELIEAFNIFLNSKNVERPIHCEHDVMYVQYNPEDFSQDNIDRLKILGFTADYEEHCFYSYKYGS